ncbi:MAG: TonB-dependent receptor [Bacteroidota bacterium]|nr:TonB-dependent receptor [Candidatus Kapabacteria bacterium]MDW8220529.1 TonB-dependent receptor [Bacteroidota bacterium]
MQREKLNTHQKALRINLDPRWYGTFAEIGAGQEVVRWFFRVGAAAGTISKSISAYDMTVSDAIYGECERYVSRPRLESMLEYEHRLNLERLSESRGDDTAFFAFADTVAALTYKGTNECHGWMGVRYQARPRDEDSQIIMHVRMLDRENALQQEALGIVGVNLLYGAFYLHQDPEELLESLLDGLTTDRIEIDMIEFSGIEFRNVDNRLMSLKLVQLGLSEAAMFAADGEVLQPSEVLYKRPVLVERGSFRPVCFVNIDMLEAASEKFAQEPDVQGKQIIRLMELTMHKLTSGSDGDVDPRDFLARADVLAASGMTVMISEYFEYERLVNFLSRCTKERIAITMGAGSLMEIFDEKYYEKLEGGILESFGRLFKTDVKLYIYPLRDPKTQELYTVQNLPVPPKVRPLYDYLVQNNYIVQLDNYNEKYLHIFSRDILRKIKEQDPTWEDMVPPEVAKVIKQRGFFGYKRSAVRV